MEIEAAHPLGRIIERVPERVEVGEAARQCVRGRRRDQSLGHGCCGILFVVAGYARSRLPRTGEVRVYHRGRTVAQSWRVKSRPAKRPRPPLDPEGLERLGLFYAGRYATTRAKLAAYLRRKLRERGWSGPGEAAGRAARRAVRKAGLCRRPRLRLVARRLAAAPRLWREAGARRPESCGHRRGGFGRGAGPRRGGSAGGGPSFRTAAAARPLCRNRVPTGRRGARRRRRWFAPATAWSWSARCSICRRRTFRNRMSHKNNRKRFTSRAKAVILTAGSSRGSAVHDIAPGNDCWERRAGERGRGRDSHVPKTRP